MRILTLSTNLIKEIRRVTLLIILSRSATKKRKMIRDINNLCEIPMAIIKGYDCPLKILSDVVLSFRKLLIY